MQTLFIYTFYKIFRNHYLIIYFYEKYQTTQTLIDFYIVINVLYMIFVIYKFILLETSLIGKALDFGSS